MNPWKASRYALVALLACGVAYGQAGGPMGGGKRGPGRSHRTAEATGDGSALGQDDTSGAGSKRMPPPPPPPISIDKFDTDKDGKISLAELIAGLTARDKERFDKIDTDKDGKISADEYKAAQPPAPPPPDGEKAGKKAGKKEGKKDGKKAGPHGGPPHRPSFDSLDTDKDGYLTFEEFAGDPTKKANAIMKRLDANGDGSITSDEIEAAKPPRRPSKKA